MKRDMDLVRKILFKMEDEEKHSEFSEGKLKIDGYTKDVVTYHMKIMAQADLLHADMIESPKPIIEGGWQTPKLETVDYSISWEGHEFLDAARDDSRWEKAKTAMSQVGGFALDVMKQLLVQYLKAELKLP